MQQTAHNVPHLTTALKGPLEQLETILLDKQARIEGWFRRQFQNTRPPLYASVDLRNAGFKLAPVDTNLFPAGFNNLNPAFYPLAVQAMQTALERVCPMGKNILLIPENHTRNKFYLENLAILRDLITKSGYEVKIGSIRDDLESPETIALDSGKSISLEKIERTADRVHIGEFYPCSIVLNNDLSGGHPAVLKGIRQSIIPPLALGWSNRTKSQHFTMYREVASEFAALVDVDPWFVDPLFTNCGAIDFKNREGEDCLAKSVEMTLAGIQEKYQEHGIEREPFVIVKADAGTYGMGIMTAKSAADVQELNRKQRNKMSSAKEGQEVSQVLIQEGVYTFEDWDGAAAEPVIYMIDQYVVGGFYRVHTKRGTTENLNAPGMHFEPLAFAEACNNPDKSKEPDAEPNRFYAYGVIARLALLAAAREIADQQETTK